jgi:hypothetical protein
MTEPDVALTDYLLALECGLFSHLLSKTAVCRLRSYGVCFFAALAIASLAGGTVHGFFLDETTVGYHVLWRLTLVAIGIVSYFTLLLAAEILGNPRLEKVVVQGAGIAVVLYCSYVILVNQQFVVATLCYLPSTLLLLVVFILKAGGDINDRYFHCGTIGLSVTLGAAALQYFKIGIHLTCPQELLQA